MALAGACQKLFASPRNLAHIRRHDEINDGIWRGEYAQDGFKVTVEMSSVNRKQSEITVYLPRELEPLEPQIRDEINRRIARGRLTTRVSLHAADGRSVTRVRLNADLAKEYARELQRLARDLDVSEKLSLDLLARAPGVMQLDEAVGEASVIGPRWKRPFAKPSPPCWRCATRKGTI